jgi:hypothetical protein
MSIFTVDECDRMIAALKCRLIEDPGGSIGTISVEGHTVSYTSAEDLEARIKLFTRLKADATRSAAGTRRGLGSVADFRGCR